MSGNIIACRTSSFRPFEERALEHIAALGLRHVEIFVPPGDQFDARAAELDRHGLRASSLHGECDLSRPDIADRIAEQMPAFDALNCRIMFTSAKAGDVPLSIAHQRLRAAGDVADRHDVTIVLETHPDLATDGALSRRTMLAVDHPRVRINYDTANVYFYNKAADGLKELRATMEFVAAVHLKDTNGEYQRWHFPALGEGIVDFPATFRMLDEHGFDGPYTLEIEGIEGEERTEQLARDRVAASVEYLKQCGRM